MTRLWPPGTTLCDDARPPPSPPSSPPPVNPHAGVRDPRYAAYYYTPPEEEDPLTSKLETPGSWGRMAAKVTTETDC